MLDNEMRTASTTGYAMTLERMRASGGSVSYHMLDAQDIPPFTCTIRLATNKNAKGGSVAAVS
eukprot:1198290-Amphidinium_carterae.3